MKFADERERGLLSNNFICSGGQLSSAEKGLRIRVV
jgi:hypothetical protein